MHWCKEGKFLQVHDLAVNNISSKKHFDMNKTRVWWNYRINLNK